MKVTISGMARAFALDSEVAITDPDRLQTLDGLSYSDDECGEYLDEALYDIGVIGGKIELRFDAEQGVLRVETSYHAPRKLKKTELQQLVDETRGQWSDGIGEGEFLHAQELGIDVSICADETPPQVDQFDDGVVVKKPRKSELVKLLDSRHVDEAAVVELIKRGAAVDGKNRYGQFVLELACRAVLPEAVAQLLKRGALEKSGAAARPLSALALCYGSESILENSVRIAAQLVQAGVEVEELDEDGRTPLMMAVNRGNLPLVKYLLGAGAEINRQQADTNNQLTVLMFAQDLDVLRYLLENGANPNICTAFGENAHGYQLMNSHQKGYREMAQLLEQYLTKK